MKTLVIGASEKPERYSNMAVNLLREHNQDVVALGAREGAIGDVPIQTGLPNFGRVDTVTLYVSPKNQGDYIAYVIALFPRRVIFNPGTENPLFQAKLSDAGIEYQEACTLVLLRTGQW
jgi:predicted CoA-binding protein